MSVILALDVSSSAVGYATFAGRELRKFGVIRPRAKDSALERIDTLVLGVRKVYADVAPDLVVFEVSAGKTHGRIAKASGLSVLGHSQGQCLRALIDDGAEVATYSELEWTKSVSKARRGEKVAMFYPAYQRFSAAKKDAGLDCADAIGLALYYLGKVATAAVIEKAGRA
jgi:Holliday junction resolvasome RuvABC endonuclease subunit